MKLKPLKCLGKRNCLSFYDTSISTEMSEPAKARNYCLASKRRSAVVTTSPNLRTTSSSFRLHLTVVSTSNFRMNHHFNQQFPNQSNFPNINLNTSPTLLMISQEPLLDVDPKHLNLPWMLHQMKKMLILKSSF